MIDPALRKAIVYRSHLWFFGIYFYEYIKYPMADFHYEIFQLTQDRTIKLVVLPAFRGCGKTTIIGQSFPIWAIIGAPQKKYVLIISKTIDQARQHFKNIRNELEHNELLKCDLGPFYEENEEWKSYSLVIPKYNARITAVSSEQSIRGTKNGSNRPDLIILDDVEDLESVKTKESRDKTYQWFTGDIIPIGDIDTQIYLIGNMLHQDSLIMRCKKDIEEGKRSGIYRQYPLINDNGNIMWAGKFPDIPAIDQLKKIVGDEVSWQREYQLKIIPTGNQIIYQDWIHYYDKIKENNDKLRYTITGVDPAISEKETADYTAMVTLKVYGYREDLRIYVLPGAINERINFPDTVKKLKQLSNLHKSRILIENVAYQKSLAEQLKHENISAEEASLNGNDKRARLIIISHLFANGRILFPKHGVEDLITQILGFGVEKHDDLVDALTIAVIKIIEEDKKFTMPEVWCF